VLFAQQTLAAAASSITYVNSIPGKARIIDVREINDCKKSTLATASCLPVEDLMASTQRLANFSGLLWKLGTIGLDGSEHVLVIGNGVARKDFVAGILYLAGQHKISILENSVSDLANPSSKWSFSKGTIAASTRKQVWQSQMRSNQIVLHNEMAEIVLANNFLILDGRSDAEYWGQVVKAHRGGHIPGADYSGYTHWIESPGNSESDSIVNSLSADQPIIVYAADTYSGISYYTRVIAAGLTARVYLDGWVRWAAQTDLPTDAVSYSKSNSSSTKAIQNQNNDSTPLHANQDRVLWVFWGLSVAIAFISGYIISRTGQRKS